MPDTRPVGCGAPGKQPSELFSAEQGPAPRDDPARHRPQPQPPEPILAAYAQALNAESIVVLEGDLLPAPPQITGFQLAICDDFFGSLDDQNKKRTAWIQLQPARKPTCTD
ncbi:MAG: hypothetical protein FWD65_07585 [Coriobacteriia bacterium]|nr:hypothetical protein [Coriobacteriia bacterium]